MAKGLPDRPASTQRPDINQLRERMKTLKATREARIQAGRDGKN